MNGLGFANIGKTTSANTGNRAAAASTASKSSGGLGKFLPWLLIAGLIWLLSSLFGRGSGVDIDRTPIDLSKSKSVLGNMVDSAKDGVGAVTGKAVDGIQGAADGVTGMACLLYTSPSPRDRQKSRMPSSA